MAKSMMKRTLKTTKPTDALALHGGAPVRRKPFPKRTPFGKDEIRLVTQALESQNLFYWTGRMVSDFEKGFARLYAAKHAVASTSGTASIHLAVGAVNPNPGDEIITAPITDLGTVTPILQQNAIPIFADIDATYNMDPADVERKITPRTRAIIVVHLFGNACRMEAMVRIARRHKLTLIEDCSQAHYTHYKGRLLGTFGDIGCFSLQQSKHMTTGDGGITITSDEKFYDRMKFFADKGFRRQGYGPRSYAFLAPCYRMNEQTGAVGLAQLKKVRAVVRKRHKLGTLLTGLITGIDGIVPAPVTPGAEHTYWAYSFQATRWKATDFAKAMAAEGLPSMPGYIGNPIFVCAESLHSKITYGDSHFPFDSPYTTRKIEYDESLCPVTQSTLDHMLTFWFNENYTAGDMRDIAAIIRKVAQKF